jgi:hypothetical protein
MEILIICVITYVILLVVLFIFMERRLDSLYEANTSKVPADDNGALRTLHGRLKIVVRVMSFLLLVGGIFILITLA